MPQFRELAKPNAEEEIAKAKGDLEGAQPLRPYQEEAVARMLGQEGNFVLAAPTGSGKTRIFVELGR